MAMAEKVELFWRKYNNEAFSFIALFKETCVIIKGYKMNGWCNRP